MKTFEFSNFDYNGWVKHGHDIVNDPDIKRNLFDRGYDVVENFLNQDLLDEFMAFYNENHSVETNDGGFFVSIYSKDLGYRRKVHDFMLERLKDKFDGIFSDYKHTCLNYAVKYPGKRGQIFIHQDMGQVDETQHAQVGIWIPLVDVSIENGTMGILPYTHFTIPPHRSLYHDLPYSKLYSEVFDYMQPLELKAGDLFLFDIRLLHNSFVNQTENPRVAIASSVVPQSASFCMAYREKEAPEEDYELLELDDDFYLSFADFKSEKVSKPGKSTGNFVKIREAFVSKEEFAQFCQYYGLEKTGVERFKSEAMVNPIQEPNHFEDKKEPELVEQPPKLNLFQRIKQSLLN